MYITNSLQRPAITVWNFQKQKIQRVFQTKNEFLHFVATFFRESIVFCGGSDPKEWREWWRKELTNSFLEWCICHINEQDNTPRDICYQIFDDWDRVLVPKDVWNEALPIWEKYYKNNAAATSRQRAKWNTWQKRYYKSLPEFRKGPVPNIHCRPHCRLRCRHPRTTALKRYSCAPEQQQYNRLSWKNLPSLYDDKFRLTQKSWKSQSKRRHQWKPKNFDI